MGDYVEDDTYKSDDDGDFIFPPNKPYVVLELEYDGESYSTPAVTAWLTKAKLQARGDQVVKTAMCYWPPNDKNLDSYLERQKVRGSDWTLQPCRILTFCGTLKDAKQKAKSGEERSDFSTSEAAGSPPPKRTRKATSPFQHTFIYRPPSSQARHGGSLRKDPLASSGSEDEEPRQAFLFLKLLSAGTSGFATGAKETLPGNQARNPAGNSSGNLAGNPAEKPAGNLADKPAEKPTEKPTGNLSGHSDGNSARNQAGDQAGAGDQGQRTPTKGNRRGPSFTPKRHSTPDVARTPTKVSDEARPVSKKVFMREINIVKDRLNKLQLIDQKIVRMLSPVDDGTFFDGDGDGNVPSLPVGSLESFLELEAFLSSSEDNRITLVRLLVPSLRSSVNDSVKAMMPTLLTNVVAMHYNMDGVNRKDATSQKSAFKDTNAFKCLVAALKTTFKNIEGKDPNLRVAVGNWLKNAPKRNKKECNRGVEQSWDEAADGGQLVDNADNERDRVEDN